jgi:hypothetical protein
MDLLKELGSWESLPQVVAGFPKNTLKVQPTALKGLKSIDLGSMQLKNLSQRVVRATLSLTLSFRLNVSSEVYEPARKCEIFK